MVVQYLIVGIERLTFFSFHLKMHLTGLRKKCPLKYGTVYMQVYTLPLSATQTICPLIVSLKMLMSVFANEGLSSFAIRRRGR